MSARSFDCPRLLNIERLSRCNASRSVDKHDAPDLPAARERVRHGAAKLAGSDDANRRHDPVGYCNDTRWWWWWWFGVGSFELDVIGRKSSVHYRRVAWDRS